MDQVHHVVVISEGELIAVELLHAPRLELPQGDLLVAQLPVELLVSQFEQLLEQGDDRGVLLVVKDLLDQLLGPLVHEVIVSLELLELPLVDTIHIFILHQSIYHSLLFGLFLFNLPLHLIQQSLILLQ